MPRKLNDDFSNSLNMLHSTVMHTSKEIKEDLTRGFEAIRTSGEQHQNATETAVNSELSRMRTDLRETKNRLTNNGVELSQEVQALLETVQRELRDLSRAVRDTAPARTGAAGDPPAGQSLVEAAPAPAANGRGLGTLTGTSTEWATTNPAPAVAANDRPPGEAAVSVPGPRQASDQTLPAPEHPDTADTPPDEPTLADTGDAEAPASEERAHTEPAPDDLLLAVREAVREEVAALNESVAEARTQTAVLREEVTALASREQVDGLTDRLADLPGPGVFTAAVEEAVAGLRAELRETRARLEDALAANDPVPEVDQEQTQAEADHAGLLREAARVSRAGLVCHRDLWDFVVGQTDHHPHFRTPQQIEVDQDERIEAQLSGRSLIAVLISLWTTKNTAPGDSADWALATTLYQRINDALSELKTDGTQVTITLDDRAADHAQLPALNETAASDNPVDEEDVDEEDPADGTADEQH